MHPIYGNSSPLNFFSKHIVICGGFMIMSSLVKNSILYTSSWLTNIDVNAPVNALFNYSALATTSIMFALFGGNNWYSYFDTNDKIIDIFLNTLVNLSSYHHHITNIEEPYIENFYHAINTPATASDALVSIFEDTLVEAMLGTWAIVSAPLNIPSIAYAGIKSIIKMNKGLKALDSIITEFLNSGTSQNRALVFGNDNDTTLVINEQVSDEQPQCPYHAYEDIFIDTTEQCIA